MFRLIVQVVVIALFTFLILDILLSLLRSSDKTSALEHQTRTTQRQYIRAIDKAEKYYKRRNMYKYEYWNAEADFHKVHLESLRRKMLEDETQ